MKLHSVALISIPHNDVFKKENKMKSLEKQNENRYD